MDVPPFEPVPLPVALWIFLLGLVVLQLLLIGGLLSQRSRLKRMESLLSKYDRSAPSKVESTIQDGEEKQSGVQEGGEAFQQFLDEDPSRLSLPKKEQFATYREWRSKNGLNWSSTKNSD